MEKKSTCPYCNNGPLPLPEKEAPHLHVECPFCHARPAVKWVHRKDAPAQVVFYRDGKKPSLVPTMQVVSLRVPAELAAKITAPGGRAKARDCLLTSDW